MTGELGKFHSGQDFAARAGTPIPAAAPGEVVCSGFNDNFGNTVIVRNEAGYTRLLPTHVPVRRLTRVSQAEVAQQRRSSQPT
ncbi:M23 family metallopeptidase [Bradyrhizobium sp. URHA0013]|uniref:M23 family metallopeptidase n=1 Tax=Bradyrhizobium sp. URHA0013 TaxID=1380352 RepID=UPI0009DE1512